MPCETPAGTSDVGSGIAAFVLQGPVVCRTSDWAGDELSDWFGDGLQATTDRIVSHAARESVATILGEPGTSGRTDSHRRLKFAHAKRSEIRLVRCESFTLARRSEPHLTGLLPQLFGSIGIARNAVATLVQETEIVTARGIAKLTRAIV